MSVAIIPMALDFGWSPSVSGVVQSAFFYGYLVCQLPSGWLSNRFGGRTMLPVGVGLWSLATAGVPLLASTVPGRRWLLAVDVRTPYALDPVQTPSSDRVYNHCLLLNCQFHIRGRSTWTPLPVLSLGPQPPSNLSLRSRQHFPVLHAAPDRPLRVASSGGAG
eukprot:362129-Chlamydomonas_euryale.AAC.7